MKRREEERESATIIVIFFFTLIERRIIERSNFTDSRYVLHVRFYFTTRKTISLWTIPMWNRSIRGRLLPPILRRLLIAVLMENEITAVGR